MEAHARADRALVHRSDRQREVRHFVPCGKIHQNGNLQVGDEIKQEIFELVLFGPIEREVSEYDAAHVT